MTTPPLHTQYDEDEWDEGGRPMGGPRIRLFPPTNAHNLQQILDDLVIGMGNREGGDRRRYRIISRRDIANGGDGNASGQRGSESAAPEGGSQHALLTRPGNAVMQRMNVRGVDVQFGMPGGGAVPLDRSMAVCLVFLCV